MLSAESNASSRKSVVMKNLKVSPPGQILLASGALKYLLGSYLHYHSDKCEWLIANPAVACWRYLLSI